MKLFITLFCFLFILVSNSLAQDSKNYSKDEVLSIAKSALSYYSKGECKKAIPYLSSPAIKKVKKYDTYKFFQADCHYRLKEYAKAQYTVGLINKDKLSSQILEKVYQLENNLNKKANPLLADKLDLYLDLYYGDQNFDKEADKERATVSGVASTIVKKQSVFEFGAEQYKLTFNDITGLDDYKQNSYYLGYSTLNAANTDKHRFFTHYVNVGNQNSFETMAFLYGYKHFFDVNYYAGINLSSTYFTVPDNSLDDFYSFQITPNFKKGLGGNFYLTLFANLSVNTYKLPAAPPPATIMAAKGKGGSGSSLSLNSYASADIILSYMTDHFIWDLSYLVGKERFMLKSEGLVVQNFTDTVTSAVAGMGTWLVHSSFSLSVKYQAYNYTSERDNRDSQSTMVLGFGSIYF